MQSSHQTTHTSEEIVGKTIELGDVKYNVSSLLGSGYTAKVYKAQKEATVINDVQSTIAVKLVGGNFVKGFQDEVNCLYNCGNHPNIVKMLGFFGGSQDCQSHVIALEFCESDLFNVVTESKGLNEDVCRFLFAGQLVPAVAHLHSKGICHRDLKLDNILLKGDQVKIADFTFGASMFDDKKQPVLFTQRCGTKVYMAPEIQRGCQYRGDQVDVFSLGVCLFMMHMGQNPFPTGQFYHLLWKKPQTFWRQFAKRPTKEFKELVQSMLECDPKKRITLDQVKAHSWTDDSSK